MIDDQTSKLPNSISCFVLTFIYICGDGSISTILFSNKLQISNLVDKTVILRICYYRHMKKTSLCSSFFSQKNQLEHLNCVNENKANSSKRSLRLQKSNFDLKEGHSLDLRSSSTIRTYLS